jgi:hypothetical protein
MVGSAVWPSPPANPSFIRERCVNGTVARSPGIVASGTNSHGRSAGWSTTREPFSSAPRTACSATRRRVFASTRRSPLCYIGGLGLGFARVHSSAVQSHRLITGQTPVRIRVDPGGGDGPRPGRGFVDQECNSNIARFVAKPRTRGDSKRARPVFLCHAEKK